jgi:hypothetical protein
LPLDKATEFESKKTHADIKPLLTTTVKNKQTTKGKIMSWAIKTVGRPKNVLAEVAGLQGMPQGLKDTVREVANDIKDGDYQNGLFVESHGHIGGISNARFTCEAIHFAIDVPARDESPAPNEKPNQGSMVPPATDSAPRSVVLGTDGITDGGSPKIL